MRKINLLPAVIIISIFFLINCDGNIANDSSLPPLNYSHLITGIGGLQSHPDLTNETPWELHFDTTGENYDATFLGTLATGQYRIDISGLHWPDWPTADGLEISCLDSISLPLASNSVIFQTPLFNNKFELTDG